MPTLSEFSWAAFLYGAIGGDKDYQQIMNNTKLLYDLRNRPHSLSADQIQENVVKGFLNRWKCRLPNSPKCANKILTALQDLQPLIFAIRNNTIRDSITTNVNLNMQSSITLGKVIEECYMGLYRCTDNFAATATSKLLHILNPSLFVMRDAPILKHYQGQNPLIKENSNGYKLFIIEMQKLISTIDKAFTCASSVLPPAKSQFVEDYLSSKMGYNPPKTAAKYLDEYNWVVITNKVNVPPRWHPN